MVSTSNTSNSSTTTTGEEAGNGETEGENDEAGSRLIVAIILATFIIFLCI